MLADPVLEAGDVRLGTVLTPGGESSEEYERLLYSREEAEAILALVSPERGFMALDFDASREVILSGRLREYDILHLATHGYLSTDHPELSGILLSSFDEQGRERSQDGLLSLHDIYGLDLSAKLVVLSACRTALGQEIRGEGLVGLTRGFMYAGAPRVVVSLWDVNDRATAELMKRFYKAMLLDGKPPAAALRAAQVSMLEEPRFRNPIFWASFVLQGDWQ